MWPFYSLIISLHFGLFSHLVSDYYNKLRENWSSFFELATYNVIPKIVILISQPCRKSPGAFGYHKLLNIIVFSLPLFRSETRRCVQSRDAVIHLLQCDGKWLPSLSLWGCRRKKSVYTCVWVSVRSYGWGTVGQPVAHSRDRKWLQYGPECGLSQGSGEWFRPLVRSRTEGSVRKKNLQSEKYRCFVHSI